MTEDQPVPETQDHDVSPADALKAAQEALAAAQDALAQVPGAERPEPDDTGSMAPVEDDSEGEDSSG